jgi:hypothetical protein
MQQVVVIDIGVVGDRGFFAILFLIFKTPVHLMVMSMALPLIWLLVNAGGLLPLGGTASPNPVTICWAPFLLSRAFP